MNIETLLKKYVIKHTQEHINAYADVLENMFKGAFMEVKTFKNEVVKGRITKFRLGYHEMQMEYCIDIQLKTEYDGYINLPFWEKHDKDIKWSISITWD